MQTMLSKRDFLAAFGALFRYPEAGPGESPLREPESLAEVSACLEAFLGDLRAMPLHEQQDIYTRSFDISPVCVPYASVHLFGADSYKRAELMTGLNLSFQQVGHDRGTELPDHIAVLLECAPLLPEEEWLDLVQFVLKPATALMLVALEKAGSPWRHLMKAAILLLESEELPHD